MEFGVGYFSTHDAAGPGVVASLVEQHGFESLFFSEHTHIPAARTTPFNEGGPLPRKYLHTYDLIVAMTAAVTATSRLRVGSGICLLPQHDPIVLAKAVASLDHLSGGRIELGIGAGWNREEMANHGTDPRTRMALMRERVLAMQQIWTQDEASFHGDFVDFDRIWSWPKPVQRPYPPVLVGGMGATVEQRILDYANGWFPNHLPDFSLIPRWKALQESADRPLSLSVQTVPAEPEIMAAYQEAGANRLLHWLPSAPLGMVQRELEVWERAIAELTGR
ncbi:MAG: LLM class F420-dependent oxidoreductase [Nakamurella sp.]